MATKKNDHVLAAVREALEENRDATIDELLGLVKNIDPVIGNLTRRQFNAYYVLPVKREMAKPAPRPKAREISGTLQQIAPERMIPYPGLNPRKHFDEEKHQELVASIREHGNFQPVIVTAAPQSGPLAEKGIDWWICAGERRWRAAKDAHAMLLCLVRSLAYGEAVEMAGLENLHRDDLTAIEEARWIRKMLEVVVEDEAGTHMMTQRQVAEKIGRSQPWVSNRLRLLELPEEILGMIEAGTLDASATRDCILPFTGIPKEKRAKLFDRVAKQAGREHAEDGQLSTQTLHRIVADLAVKISHSLNPDDYGDDSPLFDPKLHRGCGCGGPTFRYRPWGNSERGRCFDDDWWNAHQKEAREQLKAAEAEMTKRLQDDTDAGNVSIMTADAFTKAYGWQAALPTEFRSDHWTGRDDRLVDAGQLADAELIVVRDARGDITPTQVHCVDDKAMRRARAVVGRERNQRLQELKARRADEDRQEAGVSDLAPWMLAEILASRPQRDDMLEVGRDLGLDVGKHGELDEHIKALPPEELHLLFKVLAIRSKRQDLGWRDPLPKQVEGELRKKYGPGLRALVKKAIAAVDGAKKGAAA